VRFSIPYYFTFEQFVGRPGTPPLATLDQLRGKDIGTLDQTGIRLSPFVASVLGLGLNYAASEAEVDRAGLLPVSAGQWHSAYALGLTRGNTLRLIIIPQAIRLVLPPFTNDFIALLKDSSLVSSLTMMGSR
jgi:polar amino acid transport system substrate-binding protein